jgi:hypothetical protein
MPVAYAQELRGPDGESYAAAGRELRNTKTESPAHAERGVPAILLTLRY